MAEFSSPSLAALTGSIGLASLLPGIDGNALIGAFTGAALVVVTSTDLTIGKRFAYLVISLAAGYLAAAEVVRLTPLKSTAVGAFFAAALAITVTVQIIERIKSFDLLSLIKKG